MPWKVIFALCPPTIYYNGWATFTIALLMIGVVTGFIGDLAGLFGCSIGMPDSVTAISFVALGTSLPDTFASMAAVKADDSADAAIGNVTGSNAVPKCFFRPWHALAHCKHFLGIRRSRPSCKGKMDIQIRI